MKLLFLTWHGALFQVMESMRMPFTEAIQHVQSRRCCIHISEALHNQLREFETIYQNRGVSFAVSVHLCVCVCVCVCVYGWE
jgi:hypothetical protein